MVNFSEPELAFFQNLNAEISQISPDSIISRTLLNNDRLKVVLFGFAQGQELSEHTASMPAIIHILQGEAQLVLGGEHKQASPGSWAYMPADLPHSVYAKSTLIMLLLMLKTA